MADEAQPDVNSEITTDIFADTVEPTTSSEPSTEEPEAAPAPEPGDEPEPEQAEGETPAEPAEGDSQEPKRGADARKEQLTTEIRDLVAQRNAIRDEVSRTTSEVYQPQTAEQLIEQGIDPAEARIQALEERAQLAEFQSHVAEVQYNLEASSQQVLQEFPVFNPNSPDYNKELADRAGATYRAVSGAQTDPNTGMLIAVNALPYQIYKAFAETYQASAQAGQVTGQRAAEKMLANTDTPSVAAPKAPKADALVELWKD